MSFNKLHPAYCRAEQCLPLSKVFPDEKEELCVFNEMCTTAKALLQKLSPETPESRVASARLRKVFFPLPNTWELFGLGKSDA